MPSQGPTTISMFEKFKIHIAIDIETLTLMIIIVPLWKENIFLKFLRVKSLEPERWNEIVMTVLEERVLRESLLETFSTTKSSQVKQIFLNICLSKNIDNGESTQGLHHGVNSTVVGWRQDPVCFSGVPILLLG